MRDYNQRIDELVRLGDGWLDGGGRAMTAAAIATARVLAEILRPGLYSIFPRPCGGIQFEMTGGIEFRIEASGDLMAEEV